MLKTYLITISILASSCSSVFPTNQVIYIDQAKHTCDLYKLDSEEIKVTFDKNIEYSKCPTVVGFELKDSGKVMNWIRKMKAISEECQ